MGTKHRGEQEERLLPSSHWVGEDGAWSGLKLKPLEQNVATYKCQANNSVGPGNSCSYTVLRSSLGIAHKITAADTIAVVTAAIVVAVSACIAASILLCRRRLAREKLATASYSPGGGGSSYTAKPEMSSNGIEYQVTNGRDHYPANTNGTDPFT